MILTSVRFLANRRVLLVIGHKLRECFYSFWSKNPALFLGLSLLLGTATSFQPQPSLGILFAALCLTAKSRRTLTAAILCFSGAFITTAYRHPKILLPQEKLHGKGTFHIEQIKIHSSPFHRSLLYKGTLNYFETDGGKIFEALPCNIFFPLFGKRPPADTDYTIQGTLCQKGDYAFVLKQDKNTAWTSLSSPFNLSEWRFCTKQAVSYYLKKEIADPHARTFLNALATGDIDERILSMEFGKVGLQHILAISGFHFALAALFLNSLFHLLFPGKISIALLICTLSLYSLFLGNAPSTQRAFIAISLIAAGQLFSMKITGLNALGAGLIAELLLTPLAVTQLSFQLTFLCTLAILLFYPISHRFVALLLPKRTYSQTRNMSLFDKHGYLISVTLRQALALNCAVHLISLPVLLHLFHKFPLLSIAYNLFFPTCVCLSMFLLFTALLFAPLLPFLSHAIHALNNTWTAAILTLTANPPAILDFSMRTQTISFFSVASFLAISFFLGIILHEKSNNCHSL
jgi:competence protein ComEC